MEGNQQTAHMMTGDIVRDALPIASGPDWGVPLGVGLGVEVNEDKLKEYHELYLRRGQFQPYDTSLIGADLFS